MRLRGICACLIFVLISTSPAMAQREPDKIKAVAPAIQNAAWWSKRHEEKLKEKDAMGQVDLLMIGDSITHGWESRGKTVWEQYYAKRHALNIGFSGDRTEHVIWRLQHGEVDGIAPKLAVIMIGTNNTGHRQDKPEHIAAGVKAILNELEKRLPDTKCLVLAIFPRGPNTDDRLRKINDATNEIIKEFADGRRVFYLDINNKFLGEDGTLSKEIMPDLLHPNARGYAIWAEAIEPTIEKLMKS